MQGPARVDAFLRLIKRTPVTAVRFVALNQYLLRLYAATTELSPARYAEFAVGNLCELLSASKGWWGIISSPLDGLKRHSSFRYNLSTAWDVTLDFAKQGDIAAQYVALCKNNTRISRIEDLDKGRALIDFAETFDIGRCLTAAIDLPDKSAFMFTSLYRTVRQPVFMPEDRLISDLVLPHLQNAWNQNLRESLKLHVAENGFWVNRAFIDVHGRLIRCDDGFVRVVTNHWRTWRGQSLPLRLQDAVDRSTALSGSWIAGSGWFVRAVPAGLLRLVELRENTLLDRLSPREFEVARLYAEGASHKEIAQRTSLKPATIRSYIQDIYSKLDVDNKAVLATVITTWLR